MIKCHSKDGYCISNIKTFYRYRKRSWNWSVPILIKLSLQRRVRRGQRLLPCCGPHQKRQEQKTSSENVYKNLHNSHKKLHSTLIKNKIKFSSYIRKFGIERLQSHIWLMASSYMDICSFAHILRSPSSCMTLQLLHSEFPDIWRKFDFLFYQCNLLKHVYAGSLPDVNSLSDLRGKHACFAGVGTQAGWTIPIFKARRRHSSPVHITCTVYSMRVLWRKRLCIT